MAAVSITNTLVRPNAFSDATFTAGTTDGFLFDFTANDSDIVLVFQNTAASAGTVTVKAGNGIQGVADLDTYSIAANGFSVVTLDSGRFKNVSGTNNGKVLVVPSATTIKAIAIQRL